jgi:outer membrane protein OmpA-like peptidoglycan-associated protein
MKLFKLMLVILMSGLVIALIISGCATKSEAVVEEPVEKPKEVKEEKEEVKEEVVVEEKEVEEVVEKEIEKIEEVKVEEPEITVEKKIEEIVIATEEPIRLDRDGDGVYDDVDKCPGTPKGVKVDKYGCPEKIKEITKYEFVVEFDLDSTLIRSGYYPKVQEAIDFMKAHPEAELVRVVIEGHADSTGPEKYNYSLSLRRAQSVKQLLIDELNVEPDIIQTRGFGETRPIASNKTEAGRQKNRRAVVAFSILNITY